MFASMTVSICKSMLHAQVWQSREPARVRESSDLRVVVATVPDEDPGERGQSGGEKERLVRHDRLILPLWLQDPMLSPT